MNYLCGRFYIDFEESKELADIIRSVDRKIHGQTNNTTKEQKVRDVVPTNCVPIFLEQQHKVNTEVATWGFPRYGASGVIINARSETLDQKKMFKNCLYARRCIIPATGFYEWDHNKKKYMVKRQNESELYMAGLFDYYEEIRRFVILTTKANESMARIHDRMPVLLDKTQIDDWFHDEGSAKQILLHEMPKVELIPVEQPYEQLSLF